MFAERKEKARGTDVAFKSRQSESNLYTFMIYDIITANPIIMQ